ncbi:PREDICTED: eukaryotic [Prunus dulcis]|uniref:PREDICTED: eukaryotic n=1 Tax=Prunus dulcis TaxID=3755 RepID=A0A5E4E8K1_PRUDU|nr:PREDICTED: eukaryotic [Prunus dulcis]
MLEEEKPRKLKALGIPGWMLEPGASETCTQQAGTIRKNCHQGPSMQGTVAEVSTSKTGKHGHAKCHFVGIVFFTSKKLEVNGPGHAG